jgi:hypothetical protein
MNICSVRQRATFIFLILVLSACKTSPYEDKRYANSLEGKTYKLKLNPTSGSLFKYEIKNESEIKLEVDDKKIDNISKTTLTVNYDILKDSTGNFALKINYDKIHIYTKSGDAESDADAENASYSINATERMLGILKDATLEATISPRGEVKSISGYKELGAKIISSIGGMDAYSKGIAQAQWDKVIGEGVIRKNLKDVFSFFPDSAVHMGDKWKIISKEKSEIPFDVVTTYRLTDISDGVAFLAVKAVMTSQAGTISYSGTDVIADLKGEQDGEYQMDIKTGILRQCEVNSEIKGQMQMMGRDIPMTIKSEVSMKQKD